MKMRDFHNATRVLWNIDRPDWMTDEQWASFSDNPHRYFIKAEDAEAALIWALIEARFTRLAS